MHRTILKLYASILIYCYNKINLIQFSLSFQSPPTFSFPIVKSQRGYFSDDVTSDTESSKDSTILFNENIILGETLDINLNDGTYSWSNPKANRKDDIRSPINQQSSSEITRYKRIEFDGCGSILLHQDPDRFVEPKHNGTSSDCQHKTGRTGVTLWSAAFVVSYYIDSQWSKYGQWYIDNDKKNIDNTLWTVLELGAGLGLCSAVAAKHGMNVISTDHDTQVLKLLKENLQRNHMHSSKQHIHVHSLDWMDVTNDTTAIKSHPVFIQLESLGGADLILLSDVIYGGTKPTWNALIVLLNKLRAQRQRFCLKSSKDNKDDAIIQRTDMPLVLLGYTQRRRDMSPKDEARFFSMVKAAGMEAVLIPSTSIPHSEKYMLTSLFELRWN